MSLENYPLEIIIASCWTQYLTVLSKHWPKNHLSAVKMPYDEVVRSAVREKTGAIFGRKINKYLKQPVEVSDKEKYLLACSELTSRSMAHYLHIDRPFTRFDAESPLKRLCFEIFKQYEEDSYFGGIFLLDRRPVKELLLNAATSAINLFLAQNQLQWNEDWGYQKPADLACRTLGNIVRDRMYEQISYPAFLEYLYPKLSAYSPKPTTIYNRFITYTLNQTKDSDPIKETLEYIAFDVIKNFLNLAEADHELYERTFL